MISKKLELLPFVCDKVAIGEYNRTALIRLVRECQPEWRRLQQSRISLHMRWQTLPLNRGERKGTEKAIEWSDAEVEFLHLALCHIDEWLETPCNQQLNQARSRLQMAEQAHRQYMRSRLVVEPELVEKMFRQSKAAAKRDRQQ